MLGIIVRRLPLALVLLASTSLCSAQGPGRLRIAIPDPTPISDADIRSRSGTAAKSWAEFGPAVANALTADFVRTGRFDTIERVRLCQVLAQRRIAVGKPIVGQAARALGTDLKADFMVSGSYAPTKLGIALSVQLVSLSDGSVQTTERALLPKRLDELEEPLGILARKLMSPLPRSRGCVLEVIQDTPKMPLILIDLGTAQGAGVGRHVELSTAGEPVLSVAGGEMLGAWTVPLAEAVVVSCKNDCSYARVIKWLGMEWGILKAVSPRIDLGIERMQRARLTDVSTDPHEVRGDLSVLAVTADVGITVGIPDAMLVVDGKAVKLADGKTKTALGAGTHLAEVKVGQAWVSREIAITRLGAAPADIDFDVASLEPAAAAQSEDTVVARTRPAMTADESSADDKLMSMLSKADVVEARLASLKDRTVVPLFERGLRALRIGYTKGSRLRLADASREFASVTRLAPDLAVGQFGLGLARFYLDRFGDASQAFNAAVKLDPSMEGQVPLLWWEQFSRLPDANRTMKGPESDTTWELTKEGVLHHLGRSQAGAMVWCWNPDHPWQARDLTMRARFRLISGTSFLQLCCRYMETNTAEAYAMTALTGLTQHNADPAKKHEQFQALSLTPDWHLARFEVVGTEGRLWLDDVLMLENESMDPVEGKADIGLGGIGEQELDWVLVTRN